MLVKVINSFTCITEKYSEQIKRASSAETIKAYLFKKTLYRKSKLTVYTHEVEEVFV